MTRNLKRLSAYFLACVFCLPLCACAPEKPAVNNLTAWEKYWQDDYGGELGLQQSGNQFLLAGKQYNAIGLNCFDLLTQLYAYDDITLAYDTLKVMSENGVPAVRFSVTGHGYKDLRIFFGEEEKYTGYLELICKKAEELKVGLIPSFFWLYNALPDYLDAPIRDWGREDSETVRFAMAFTAEAVAKIKNYKSVFGYEFGNEHNLPCNLFEQQLPPLPDGSKRTRTMDEDGFTADDSNFILSKFADTVRSVDDGNRMLASGNSVLRYAQYNLDKKHDWTVDTREQKAAMTRKLNPGKINTISEHLYHWDDGTSEYRITEENETVTQNFTKHVQMLMDFSRELKKPFFVGEFGPDAFTVFGDDNKMMEMRKMAVTAVENEIPLMLIWNFCMKKDQVEHSFAPSDEIMPEIFDLINEINREFARA